MREIIERHGEKQALDGQGAVRCSKSDGNIKFHHKQEHKHLLNYFHRSNSEQTEN